MLATHGLFTEAAEAFEKLGLRGDLEDLEQAWINALTFAAWRGDAGAIERIIRARYPDGQVPEGLLSPEINRNRRKSIPGSAVR
ncbi:MAG: hypothetical protein JNK37_24560 [Verrucomicrobiales bacterium]|nr:hypothetical protein [Verrucomicrobiales bacterium]